MTFIHQCHTKPSHHLARRIEELVNECLTSVKQNRVDVRIQLVPDELFHMLLNLWSKLLIVTYQQLQKLSNEPASHATFFRHLINPLIPLSNNAKQITTDTKKEQKLKHVIYNNAIHILKACSGYLVAMSSVL